MKIIRKIKIILILLLLLGIYPNYIFSQDSTRHCFINGIGIKSGIAYSKLIMKNSPFMFANGETDFLYGYSGIIFIEAINHKNIKLQTGLGFIQKGGVINADSISYYQGWNYKDKPMAILNYFTYNISLKGNLNYKRFQPYTIIGPRVDYLLYNFSRDEIYGFDNSGHGKNRINYGLSYGIGINVFFLNNNFFTEISSSYNFTPISNVQSCENCEYTTAPGLLTDKAIVINIGYKYNLYKK